MYEGINGVASSPFDARKVAIILGRVIAMRASQGNRGCA